MDIDSANTRRKIMLDSTLSASTKGLKAALKVDFNGEWRNELGSRIILQVTPDGSVRGT